MKTVIFNDHTGAEFTNLIIETTDDLNEYIEILKNNTTKFVSKIIKACVSVDRFDHCYPPKEYGNAWNEAIMIMKIKGANPLFQLDSVIAGIYVRYLQAINKEPIVINMSGGYCPLSAIQNITGYGEHERSNTKIYHIGEGTKFINLENDPELENHVKDYMKYNDPDFSYVLNLREHSKSELTDIANKFIMAGGDTVYQYTTGTDVKQMCEYVDIFFNAGIRKFIFFFSGGIDSELFNFVREMRQSYKCSFIIDNDMTEYAKYMR